MTTLKLQDGEISILIQSLNEKSESLKKEIDGLTGMSKKAREMNYNKVICLRDLIEAIIEK